MPCDEENIRFWSVLYVGKSAKKDEEGSYICLVFVIGS